MTVSHCLRCKRKTNDVDPVGAMTSNGRMMRKSICSVCGGKKSTFVSSMSGRGVMEWEWDYDEMDGDGIPPQVIAAAVGEASKGISSVVDSLDGNIRDLRSHWRETGTMSGRYQQKKNKRQRQALRMTQKEYRRLLRLQERGMIPPSLTEDQLFALAAQNTGVDLNDL